MTPSLCPRFNRPRSRSSRPDRIRTSRNSSQPIRRHRPEDCNRLQQQFVKAEDRRPWPTPIGPCERVVTSGHERQQRDHHDQCRCRGDAKDRYEHSGRVTQPTPIAPPPPPLPPPPPVPRGGPFPGAGTYAFVSSPSGRAVYPYTADSRYVLYDDGTFALRSPSSGFEWKGRYKYENEHVTFDFDWNSQNEGAVGVFDGNRMTVTYNWYMAMSDFEDAVYQLK